VDHKGTHDALSIHSPDPEKQTQPIGNSPYDLESSAQLIQKTSSASRLPEKKVDFAELLDGTLVEMIEDPDNPANSLFAVYKNGAVRIEPRVECENLVLVPNPREQGIFKHVRLPRGSQPYESPVSLLRGIRAVILDCVELTLEDAILVAAFVMSTWFIESMPVAPILALVGLPQSGKTTLLQVLNLLCRRPLLTADITSAAFYEVYEKLSPTLLVDETLTAGRQRELFHLLRTGTTRGSVTLRKGRSFKASGPKVISWTELPNDVALNSRCVIIPMQETSRTDLTKPTDQKVLNAADVLRKQLLQYRLENYKSLRLPKVKEDECLHARTRDLYQALALPIGSIPDLCRYFVRLFKAQQEINREPLSPCCAAVLGTLYQHIHTYPKDGKYTNKELTLTVNLNLQKLQETFRLNAHQVGRALTTIGFTNRKRTNEGFVLSLDLRTRERIHKLAQIYGIHQESRFRGAGFGNDCEFCMNPDDSNPASAETNGDNEIKSK
jgi:hypothetical protein